MGDRTNVQVDRIFTIPDTLENELQVRHLNESSVVKTPSGNNFEIYLRDAIKLIEEKNYEQAYQSMLWDAEVKNMIFDSL